jgi:hypothetical protein
MKHLSVVGKGYNIDKKVVGFNNVGDRIKSWGKRAPSRLDLHDGRKRPSAGIISSMRAARAGSCRIDREEQRLSSHPMGAPMRMRWTPDVFDFAPDEGRAARAGIEMANFIYSN